MSIFNISLFLSPQRAPEIKQVSVSLLSKHFYLTDNIKVIKKKIVILTHSLTCGWGDYHIAPCWPAVLLYLYGGLPSSLLNMSVQLRSFPLFPTSSDKAFFGLSGVLYHRKC